MDGCVDQSDIVCPLFSYFDKNAHGKRKCVCVCVCVLLEFLPLLTTRQFVYVSRLLVHIFMSACRLEDCLELSAM